MAETVEYSYNHFLLTFGGFMVGGHEQWQCGLRFTTTPEIPGGGPTPLQFEAALTHISMLDIWTAVAAWFGSATTGVRNDINTTLEFCKLAAIGKDGKYLYDAIEHRAQKKGTVNSTYTTPPQLAVVVSLSSGSKIGFANHGRYFLPCPSDWVNNVDPGTGQIVTVDVDALRAAQKTMIEAVSGEISTTELATDLVIMSPKRTSSVKVTSPSHKKVTRIGIGFAVDTQRSRRRSLPDGITTWSNVST